MSSIITASQKFRSEVLRRDRDALRQLSSAYSEVERRLRLDLDALMRDIAEAQRQGKTVNRDWLRRSVRYQSLIRQTKVEISAYSNGTLRFIEAKQRQAIDLGQSHAADLIQRAADISFARLPSEAIQEMVGVLRDGSPLSKVLDRLGGEAAGEIRNNLIAGLGSGHSVQNISREIRRAIDMPRWNALRLARTETLRAYRASSLRTFAENSDVLDGWIWTAAVGSGRTCFVCYALHGTFFPLSKQFFPSHPNCRCTAVPAVKGSRPNIQAGSVAFAKLSPEQQQAVLGPTRYIMLQEGASLMDFVTLTRDPDWGPQYAARPLYKMKARKAA
jgi:SPP1 gp7 family putative phage head morphogenesis protein